MQRLDWRERPIAITGFMGAGKTAVGSLLAERLGRPFFDTDPLVERRAGRTIDSFFACGQEEVFRQLEAACVERLLEEGDSVIALGGGAFLRSDTQRLLLDRALVVHLDVPWEEVETYLDEIAESRPLLRGRSRDEVHELFVSRRNVYRRAHLSVPAPRLGAPFVVDTLLAALEVH